jgi:hypothetical protein
VIGYDKPVLLLGTVHTEQVHQHAVGQGAVVAQGPKHPDHRPGPEGDPELALFRLLFHAQHAIARGGADAAQLGLDGGKRRGRRLAGGRGLFGQERRLTTRAVRGVRARGELRMGGDAAACPHKPRGGSKTSRRPVSPCSG